MFKHQQPPLIEYPENDDVPISFGGYQDYMIKSTPTTPNASSQQQRYNQQQQQHHVPRQHSSHLLRPNIYDNHIIHSDHEYENDPIPNYRPPITSQTPNIYSHTHHNTMPPPSTSGPLYGGGSQTPDISAFNFNQDLYGGAYGAAANNNPYSSHGNNLGVNQPVTQPTTPVFGSHHGSSSFNYAASPMNHHPLYQQHSFHHPSSSKYGGQSAVPQQPHSGPLHTPNNSLLTDNFKEISSPIFCEDIVSEVFDELQLSQQ